MKASLGTQQAGSGRLQRIGILLAGIGLFALLFFAEKENLNNQPGRTLSAATPNAGETVGTQGGALSLAILPPLASDPKLDTWRSSLEGSTGAERTVLLDSIINNLEARGRFGYAAHYAEILAEANSSLKTRLRAGRLLQQASRLDYISSDTTLFAQYSGKSIARLESVVDEDPNNEQALYYLGMAYVESRDSRYSMKGILNIRKVLEINPDNADASFSLGVFSIQTGQFDKAESRFEKVLKMDPANHIARYYLAYSRLQLGKTEGSVAMLEQVLSEAPDPELKQRARNLINQYTNP